MIKSLLLVILAITFSSGCGGNNETPGASVVSPIVDISQASEFLQSFDYYIDAPDGADNIHYSILNDDATQVNFTVNDIEYNFRASKVITTDELHGYYAEFEDKAIGLEADGDIISYSMDIFKIVEGGGALATTLLTVHETQEKIHLTVTTSGDIDLETMQNIAVAAVQTLKLSE